MPIEHRDNGVLPECWGVAASLLYSEYVGPGEAHLVFALQCGLRLPSAVYPASYLLEWARRNEVQSLQDGLRRAIARLGRDVFCSNPFEAILCEHIAKKCVTQCVRIKTPSFRYVLMDMLQNGGS